MVSAHLLVVRMHALGAMSSARDRKGLCGWLLNRVKGNKPVKTGCVVTRRPCVVSDGGAVGDDAPTYGIHRLPRGPPDGRFAGDEGDLAEQVDQLLAPTDEVARRQVGVVVEHLLQPLAGCPSPGGPGEAEIGLAQERQLLVRLG